MKYSIQDLADGKCAIYLTEDTTPEQLKEVLTKAFPDDYYNKYDLESFLAYIEMWPNEFYHKSERDIEGESWQSSKRTSLPTTSINTFLVKLEHGKWYKLLHLEDSVLKYNGDSCTGYWNGTWDVNGWCFDEDWKVVPATKEDLAKLGNEWEPYWEETIEEKKQAFEKAIDEHLERGLYPEYKVGQKVKIHSGCNVDRSNGKIGVISNIDVTHRLQPNIEVEVEGDTYFIYPNPKEDREFNVEILCNPYPEYSIPYPEEDSSSEGNCELRLIRRFPSGAVRSNNEGRPRPDWISPYAIEEISKVMVSNENDFGACNYMLGIPETECLESLCRHVEELKEAILIKKDMNEAKIIARSVGFNITAMLHTLVLKEKGLYKEIYNQTEVISVEEAKQGNNFTDK